MEVVNMPPQNNLEIQIEEARRTISSDGYPMSIGELTNLYRDHELTIRPEFQRYYRWNESQKSRLVESLLLGIPLPSIFVAQTEQGAWELVDGLQRVSTILELQGELRDTNGNKRPPLRMIGTKYLPGLEGRIWSDPDPDKGLSDAQRIDIKRSKLDIKIIKRGSSPAAKFDLFHRLNSYGTPLTAQEVRSAHLVATNADFFAWLESLATTPSFVSTTSLSDDDINERFDLELVVRFLVLHAREQDKISLSALRDLPTVLDDESVALAMQYPKGADELKEAFVKTFDFIENNGGADVFRRWIPATGTFKRNFLSTAFEVFGLGIGYHMAKGTPLTTDLLGTVKEFWQRPEMRGGFATGRSTEKRLTEFIPIGRDIVAAQ